MSEVLDPAGFILDGVNGFFWIYQLAPNVLGIDCNSSVPGLPWSIDRSFIPRLAPSSGTVIDDGEFWLNCAALGGNAIQMNCSLQSGSPPITAGMVKINGVPAALASGSGTTWIASNPAWPADVTGATLEIDAGAIAGFSALGPVEVPNYRTS